MAKRKGERTRAQIERDYPEAVELPVPRNGMKNLDAIARWCFERIGDHWGYGHTTIRGTGSGDEAARWHFKEAADADAFQAEFGGRRLSTAPKRRG